MPIVSSAAAADVLLLRLGVAERPAADNRRGGDGAAADSRRDGDPRLSCADFGSELLGLAMGLLLASVIMGKSAIECPDTVSLRLETTSPLAEE